MKVELQIRNRLRCIRKVLGQLLPFNQRLPICVIRKQMEQIKGHGVGESLRKKNEITQAPARPTLMHTLNNRRKLITLLLTAGALLLICLGSAPESRAQTRDSNEAAQSEPRAKPMAIDLLLKVVHNDEAKALAALAQIEQNWHESSFAPLIEMIYRVPGLPSRNTPVTHIS